MFTVRHISPTGGETIGEATGVSWMPATPPGAEPGYPDTLWVTTPKGEVQSINGGWAYVMNDTGSTIAKYNLSDADPAPKDQIKTMVDRFLAWKLPHDFSPDGGITFEKVGNASSPAHMHFTREPVGTNLLTATQAEAMIRHMLAA